MYFGARGATLICIEPQDNTDFYRYQIIRLGMACMELDTSKIITGIFSN